MEEIMDSTTLISKYLKEYNCLYKEANEIYHEAARRLHLSDSAFEIFYALFDMGDNCLQRDIYSIRIFFIPEYDMQWQN